MMLKRTFSAIDLNSAAPVAGPSKIARVEGARDVKLKLQRSLTPPQPSPRPSPPAPLPASQPSRKPLFPIPGLAKRAAMSNGQQQQRERGSAQSPLSPPRSRSPLQPLRPHGPLQRIRRRSSLLAPPSARTTRQLSVFQPPASVQMSRERSDQWLRTALVNQFGVDKMLKFWSLRRRGIGIS